jgi:hypothetical protein
MEQFFAAAAADISAAMMNNNPPVHDSDEATYRFDNFRILRPKPERLLSYEEIGNGPLCEFCKQVGFDLLAPANAYYRWTNGEEEIDFAKRQELNFSTNHRSKKILSGLSVAEGPWCYCRLNAYCYFISGTIVGKGPDGEPLIDPRSAYPVSSLMTRQQVLELLYSRNRHFINSVSKTFSIPTPRLFVFFLGRA